MFSRHRAIEVSAARVTLALVLVAALVVTRGSDRVYTDGPLGEYHGEPHVAICVPHTDEKTTISANNGPLIHLGEVPLTITGVSAVGARGFRMIDAVLVPTNGTVNGAEFPPEPERAGPTWEERVPADGATVEPKETWWFVVDLRAEDGHAEVERFRVDYRDDAGAEYGFLTGTSYFYLPDCDDSWPEWRGER
ncbi:hypothetical protein [Saccharomonospora saliphila]|uniref:hypothetical protein n=1 Tax=Saccharomonospora saliphila TaxID=369829 RepID=UPI00036999C8|nr:hypothetical protein [Saccharomonospora saliphila]